MPRIRLTANRISTRRIARHTLDIRPVPARRNRYRSHFVGWPEALTLGDTGRHHPVYITGDARAGAADENGAVRAREGGVEEAVGEAVEEEGDVGHV